MSSLPQPHAAGPATESRNAKTRLLVLTSGRRIAIEEYGDPAGEPVFFFHGWPSSRFQGAIADAAARDAGARLLALDRPGLGDSDFHPDRTLLDFPPLLAEVADALGFARFKVLGVSGGGPYALASAWALPDRVTACAVCCGAPPLAGRTDVSALMPAYRWLLALYRSRPEMMRRVFRMIRPVAAVRPPRWLWQMMKYVIPGPDAKALDDPDTMNRAWRGYAGSWKGDPDAVFGDAAIYAHPWGFDPGEITVPVRLWHGTEDSNFRVSLAEELAASIPNCAARIIEGEGHYSLAIHRVGEIFQDLAQVSRA